MWNLRFQFCEDGLLYALSAAFWQFQLVPPILLAPAGTPFRRVVPFTCERHAFRHFHVGQSINQPFELICHSLYEPGGDS